MQSAIAVRIHREADQTGRVFFSVIIGGGGVAVIILCHFRYFGSDEPFVELGGIIRDETRRTRAQTVSEAA